MKNARSQLLVLLLCAVCLLTGAYAQLTPSQDAYTITATPTKNFGAATPLDVESSQTTYIQFNLSSIPAGDASADIMPRYTRQPGAITITPNSPAYEYREMPGRFCCDDESLRFSASR